MKGQQSVCNYRVTSANGSEESTQILFTLYTHSVGSCDVWVKFSFDREKEKNSKTTNHTLGGNKSNLVRISHF